MKVFRFLFNTLLPLAILAVGFMIMKQMIASRPAPRKEAKMHPGVLVRYLRAVPSSETLLVRGSGTVRPQRESAVTPQVSGRLASISPQLVAGGFFGEGDVLFEIERVDYELALENAKAARAKAELELAHQESNARVARAEWERLEMEAGAEPNPLVLYEPQLKQARAALETADTAIRKAELDLERTSVTAPYHCRVLSEELELGQLVRSGTAVARLAGTETAEIIVPVSLEEAGLLSVPRAGSDTAGSPVVVELSVGGEVHRWQGRIDRSLGEVDPRGRLTRLVVAVNDPFGLDTGGPGGRPDLEFGLYVNVTAEGGTLDGVFRVPRLALQNGDAVWTADSDDLLALRSVAVVHRYEEYVLVGDGLREGDRIIVTPVEGAAPGMKLRPVEEERVP